MVIRWTVSLACEPDANENRYGWEVEKKKKKENLKVVVGAFTIIEIFCLLYTEFYFKYLYYRHINIIFDTAYFHLVEPLKYFSVAIVFASLYANLFMPTRIKKKRENIKILQYGVYTVLLLCVGIIIGGNIVMQISIKVFPYFCILTGAILGLMIE